MMNLSDIKERLLQDMIKLVHYIFLLKRVDEKLKVLMSEVNTGKS
jgi:hypothetical protein